MASVCGRSPSSSRNSTTRPKSLSCSAVPNSMRPSSKSVTANRNDRRCFRCVDVVPNGQRVIRLSNSDVAPRDPRGKTRASEQQSSLALIIAQPQSPTLVPGQKSVPSFAEFQPIDPGVVAYHADGRAGNQVDDSDCSWVEKRPNDHLTRTHVDYFVAPTDHRSTQYRFELLHCSAQPTDHQPRAVSPPTHRRQCVHVRQLSIVRFFPNRTSRNPIEYSQSTPRTYRHTLATRTTTCHRKFFLLRVSAVVEDF